MNFLPYAIEFAAQTVVLTVALLVMIKLQSLDFNWPGLFGSAALASALDMIPFFGHYLAVPILYLCIWKVTHADLFPDAVFTVVIAYALMFCASMFLLAGLGPDLRPSAQEADISDDEFAQMMKEAAQEEKEDAAKRPPAEVLSTPASAVDAGTNAQSASDIATARNAAAAQAAAQLAASEKAAAEKAKTLSLRGVTKGSSRSTAVVHSGVSSYTLVLGETSTMRTPSGVIAVRFEDLGDDWVVLNIDGAKVKLVIR